MQADDQTSNPCRVTSSPRYQILPTSVPTNRVRSSTTAACCAAPRLVRIYCTHFPATRGWAGIPGSCNALGITPPCHRNQPFAPLHMELQDENKPRTMANALTASLLRFDMARCGAKPVGGSQHRVGTVSCENDDRARAVMTGLVGWNASAAEKDPVR